MTEIICYILLGIVGIACLAILVAFISTLCTGGRPQENVQSAQIEYEGETYEFRFWTESNIGDWTWAGVYKVLPPKIKRGKKIPQSECIDSTCWATDRVEWCWKALAQHVNSAKIEQRDLEKVAEFCGDAEA